MIILYVFGIYQAKNSSSTTSNPVVLFFLAMVSLECNLVDALAD